MCVKTAISLPDDLFHAADEAAGRLGMSRSELYQRAIHAWLEIHAGDGITERLNGVYSGESSTLDPVLAALQLAALRAAERW